MAGQEEAHFDKHRFRAFNPLRRISLLRVEEESGHSAAMRDLKSDGSHIIREPFELIEIGFRKMLLVDSGAG